MTLKTKQDRLEKMIRKCDTLLGSIKALSREIYLDAHVVRKQKHLRCGACGTTVTKFEKEVCLRCNDKNEKAYAESLRPESRDDD